MKVAFSKDTFYPHYEITVGGISDVEADLPEQFADEFQQVMHRHELLQSIVEDIDNGVRTDPHTDDASQCWCKPMLMRSMGQPDVWEHKR